MTTYLDEFKDSILAKKLPPNNIGIPQLVKETGIPRARRVAAHESPLPTPFRDPDPA
jgi:hypothetical protein